MPLSKIHVPETVSDEMCRRIGEMLHVSLVEICGVHPDDNFYLISKFSPTEMGLHPTFLGDRNVQATIIIEIVLLAGRSEEQKETLYRDFRERLKDLGFEPRNSIMFLVENSAIDWSFSEVGSVKTALAM